MYLKVHFFLHTSSSELLKTSIVAWKKPSEFKISISVKVMMTKLLKFTEIAALPKTAQFLIEDLNED